MKDTYEILSYAAEAWGKPLGSSEKCKGFMETVNLQGNGMNYDKAHYSHSRQFRSNIIAEQRYWNKILEECGLNGGEK